MRDLIFKNLTSKNRTRRIISAKETIDEDGIVTKIQKHLIYKFQEAKEDKFLEEINHELFITKEKNTKSKTESFFVKMKGGIYTDCNNKLYLITFLHSLKIDLFPAEVS